MIPVAGGEMATARTAFGAAGPDERSLFARLGRLIGGRLAVATAIVAAFWTVNLLLIALGLARFVPLTFPGLAILAGLFLFVRAPAGYLAFMWWLWFLTPLVRRLVDYQTGWNPVSPLMPTPYLVAAVPAAALIGRLPAMATAQLLALGLTVTGIAYAFVVGLWTAGPASAVFGLLTWLVPALFGFYLATTWRDYAIWRSATGLVFTHGMIALALYGLIQFVLVPPWDAAWMVNSAMTSIGWPFPYRVRVFSTMNAPGVLAIVLMAALLVGSTRRSILAHLGAIPVSLALLLSQVRSAWLGLVVGFCLVLVRQPPARSFRLVAGGLLLLLVLLPLLQVDAIQQVALPRLMSIGQLDDDNSLNTRLRLYDSFFDVAAGNVVGAGIGATNLATKLSNNGSLGTLGVIDSGILEILFVFGWLGSALYLSGVALAAGLAMLAWRACADPFVVAAGAVMVATLIQIVFFNPLGGAVGMVFWAFLGLTLAGQRAGYPGAGR